MLAAPSIAIDLPLKILIWEDAGGKVWVSYNSPAYLQERHSLPQERRQPRRHEENTKDTGKIHSYFCELRVPWCLCCCILGSQCGDDIETRSADSREKSTDDAHDKRKHDGPDNDAAIKCEPERELRKCREVQHRNCPCLKR